MQKANKDALVLGSTQEIPEDFSKHNKDKTSSDNSEYDSVDSYSEDEQPPIIIKVRSKASGLDSQSESEDSVILQREEGDGQESIPQKKIDDDEDKKNPQYIPKRGTFYEHDVRTAEDVDENVEENEAEKAEKEGKKKQVWQDKGEKWSHDKFNDTEQAPKSRAELVSIYGYDIRNEDGPPRARRRRRYGRGPNKYTRNWEDEEAYTKPPAPRQKVTNKPIQSETEFPPLGRAERTDRSRTKSSELNQEDFPNYKENEENKMQNRKSFERQAPSANEKQIDNKHNAHLNQDEMKESNISPRVGGTGRLVKPIREIKDSDYRGFTTKTRQTRGVRTDSQNVVPAREKKNDFIQTQNFTNKNINVINRQNQAADMEKEIKKLSLLDKSKEMGGARQSSVPPRLQNHQAAAAVEQQKGGSKRYSSMRQKSLPETGAPPAVAAAAQPTNFTFYPSDYNSTAPPPATTQPILAAPPTGLVPPPQVPVAVTTTAPPPQLIPAAYPPPQAYAPPPPTAAYLQTATPTFITAPPTAPPPQIVAYVSQPPPTFVPGFQGHSFNTVSQPTELYQPQGGITYYTPEQQVVQRAAPQKRPKAAIPIVAPTDFKEEFGEMPATQEIQE